MLYRTTFNLGLLNTSSADWATLRAEKGASGKGGWRIWGVGTRKTWFGSGGKGKGGDRNIPRRAGLGEEEHTPPSQIRNTTGQLKL